jgi:hypothetical protein
MRSLFAAAVFAAALAGASSAGCATMTGLATGAGTGTVDLPAEVVRHNASFFEQNPIFYAPDVLVLAPVGLAAGPVIGLIKGVALDVEWLIGNLTYTPVFGAYGQSSIWRPFTVQWHSSEEMRRAQPVLPAPSPPDAPVHAASP